MNTLNGSVGTSFSHSETFKNMAIKTDAHKVTMRLAHRSRARHKEATTTTNHGRKLVKHYISNGGILKAAYSHRRVIVFMKHIFIFNFSIIVIKLLLIVLLLIPIQNALSVCKHFVKQSFLDETTNFNLGDNALNKLIYDSWNQKERSNTDFSDIF